MKTAVCALHGFLGQGSDWNFLKRSFLPSAFWNPDLFAKGSKWLERDLHATADKILEEVQRRFPTGRRTLVGYSFGGRLALHMLLRAPEVFDRAVILSASPGLEDESERVVRMRDDETWASRFEGTEDWETVLQSWGSQIVLRGPAPVRREEDFDRHLLAWALREGSQGRQEPLWGPLSDLNVPLQWLAGSRDEKYAAMAHRVAKVAPKALVEIVPNVGHRLPWEAPEAVRRLFL